MEVSYKIHLDPIFKQNAQKMPPKIEELRVFDQMLGTYCRTWIAVLKKAFQRCSQGR